MYKLSSIEVWRPSSHEFALVFVFRNQAGLKREFELKLKKGLKVIELFRAVKEFTEFFGSHEEEE